MGPAPVGVHRLSCNEMPPFAVLSYTVQFTLPIILTRKIQHKIAIF